MIRFGLLGLVIALAGRVMAADDEITFKSEVSLARVDAQVVDRANRAISGLRVDDFVLVENGERKEIRNFASEDMPVDILLLLDVSGSMRPHIERIAQAANTALAVLGDEDRVGIMVFDRGTRMRLPFRRSLEGVERELNNLLNDETFDGGTDITRGLYDAIRYMQRDGRRDARRAIVILTDDQTERGRDDAGVERALSQADTVLSALIAPDAMGRRTYPRGGGGGGWPSGGGGWPMGGPLGGIILGRRGPMGGGGGPIIVGGRTSSAGTSEIALASGGDSLQVDDASALERTLRRLRQRYALYYHAGSTPARDISVHLTDTARRRYSDAEVRFRRVNLNSDGNSRGEATQVSRGRAPVTVSDPAPTADASTTDDRNGGFKRRRPAVDESGSTRGPIQPQQPAEDRQGGWRKADTQPQPAESTTRGDDRAVQQQPPPAQTQESGTSGGWRRIKPGEKP